jgi:hypothetical protein
MALTKSKLAAATAVVAAFSLAAMPAAAAQLPRVPGQAMPWNPDALNVEGHGHHGGHHGGWDDDDWDVDGDDVLAGVLILGGIAAISAIANSGRHRQESYPEPDSASYPDPDSSYQAPAREDTYRSGGMAQAVDVCVSEVEASRGPVGSVDRASRSGEGWYVAGELDGGAPFACWLDGSGQVSNIRAGDSGASYDAPDDVPAEAASEDQASYVATLQKQAVTAVPADDSGIEVAQALAN